jgi:hypothetical protein
VAYRIVGLAIVVEPDQIRAARYPAGGTEQPDPAQRRAAKKSLPVPGHTHVD